VVIITDRHTLNYQAINTTICSSKSIARHADRVCVPRVTRRDPVTHSHAMPGAQLAQRLRIYRLNELITKSINIYKLQKLQALSQTNVHRAVMASAENGGIFHLLQTSFRLTSRCCFTGSSGGFSLSKAATGCSVGGRIRPITN
jgi:hypothetical protein